ncbi:MAG: serine/threonine protein kinase [Planctomycetales bacterium]
MPPTLDQTIEQYIRAIQKSGLIEKDALHHLLAEQAEKHPDNPITRNELSALILSSGHITSWQNEKLLQGKHRGFFLGGFKLLDLLGRGAMSKVYVAEDTQDDNRRVALKVLERKRINESSALPRFKREFDIISSMRHPNIIRAYREGQEEDFHFFSMEHIIGQDLQKKILQEARLPYEHAAEYIRQTANGLEHAHSKELIHRDVKPSNLLLAKDGTIKVLDLGLAYLDDNTKLTQNYRERTIGTVDFLPPEQAKDIHNIDARADIYSLGCTLYFLITGTVPFPQGEPWQKMQSHLTKEPRNLSFFRDDVPVELAAICARMMAKDREKRFETAEKVSEAIDAWLAKRPVENRASRGSDSEDGPRAAGSSNSEGFSKTTFDNLDVEASPARGVGSSQTPFPAKKKTSPADDPFAGLGDDVVSESELDLEPEPEPEPEPEMPEAVDLLRSSTMFDDVDDLDLSRDFSSADQQWPPPAATPDPMADMAPPPPPPQEPPATADPRQLPALPAAAETSGNNNPDPRLTVVTHQPGDETVSDQSIDVEAVQQAGLQHQAANEKSAANETAPSQGVPLNVVLGGAAAFMVTVVAAIVTMVAVLNAYEGKDGLPMAAVSALCVTLLGSTVTLGVILLMKK